MDVYPEILKKIYSKKGVPNILFKWINSLTVKALEEAELIIVIGQCMDIYLNNLNIKPNKIYYFPNFSGIKSKIVLEKDCNKVKLVYAGNIGVGHSLTSIIEAAILLKDKVELFIITNEKGKKYVEGILNGNYYSNIIIFTNLSDDKFIYHLNSASFHFVSLKSEFTGLMVPSKYYSALKLGIPVIYEGSKNSEIFLDISKSKLGFAFEDGDINSLIEFLNNVITGKTFYDRNKIVNYYMENYEISHRIGSYIETIKNAFKY